MNHYTYIVTLVIFVSRVFGLSCQFGVAGVFRVGRRTLQIVDPDRDGRELTVDIWYPATDGGEALSKYLPFSGGSFVALDSPAIASGNEKFPLLVFSHGNNGVRTQSISLMEHLASWGFVVAACDHAGNSSNDSGNIPFQLSDRPSDVSLLISYMMEELGDELRLHGEVIGVLGHSYGGFTSLLMKTGMVRVPPDDRVKAILPIVAPVGQADLSRINVPTLALGAELDTIVPVDPNNDLIFEKTKGLPRWRVDILGADHNSFTELCLIFATLSASFSEETAYSLIGSGDIQEGKFRIDEAKCDTIEDSHRISNFYAAAFFRSTLMDDEEALDCLTRDYVDQENLPVIFDFLDKESSAAFWDGISYSIISALTLFSYLARLLF